MNSTRTTKLAVLVVLGLLGAGLLYYVASSLYEGIEERYATMEKLEKDLIAAKAKEEQFRRAKQRLDHWRSIGLPGDVSQANRLYRSLVENMLMSHELLPTQAEPTIATGRANKIFTPLNYQWKVEGTFQHLLSFLEDFHRLNLPHAVRELTVTRPANSNDNRLEIQLKLEALSFPNSPNRDFLTAIPDRTVLRLEMLSALKDGPTGLAFGLAQFTPNGLYGNLPRRVPRPLAGARATASASPESQQGLLRNSKLAGDVLGGRDYQRLDIKNPLVGLTPPPAKAGDSGPPKPDLEILKHVQLTMVSSVKDERTGFTVIKASVWDKLQGRHHTLRADPPLNELIIRDAYNHVLLKARVALITDDLRTLVLEVDEKFYAVHIRENLGEALQPSRALSDTGLKAYNLPTASEKDR